MNNNANSNFEKGRIQTLTSKFQKGNVSLLVSIIVLITVLILSSTYPSIFPQRQHYVIIPILIFWIYLLRNYPYQYKSFLNDINQNSIGSVIGLSILHNKPCFRVLFAPPLQLTVNGYTFDLYDFPVDQLFIGQQIQVNFLKKSKILLSIELNETKESQNPEDNTNNIDNQFNLSDLELAIIQLMANGLPDKLIARELNLEPATVRTYNTAIYRKLGVNNRKQTSEKAIELGLV